MNRCCCTCGGDFSKPKDAIDGHLFSCKHFLCKACLVTFGGSSLRSVCFTCCTPPPDTHFGRRSPPLADDDKATDNNKVSSRPDYYYSGSIIDDCPSSMNKTDVPAELIYNRVDLVLTDVILSPTIGPGGGRTEAVGQSMRMEYKAAPRSPRKPSPGGRCKPLAGFASSLREKKMELEATEKSFVEQGNQIRKEIEKHAKLYRTLIDRDEKRLLQQLDEMMQTVTNENSSAISSIRSLIQRLERTDERRDDADDEVEQLLTTRINTTQFKDVKVGLNDFCPPEGKNIVGELKVEPIPDHSSFLSTPVLISSISDVQNRPVTGLTTLDREIFISRHDSPHISVFSVMTNVHLRSLSLLKHFDPEPSPIDLAACRTSRSIYVADGTNNYVFHLRPDTGGLVHRWQVDNLRGLSVTTTGTLLAGSGAAVKEYDPSGKQLRTIGTSSLRSLFRGRERPTMKYPTHFVETDHGRIVVCDFPTDPRAPHVVYSIDRRGGAVSCWHGGGRADAGDEFLNEPRHLAVDVTGHVMVVDRRNDRVKLLDGELRFVRNLLGPGQGQGGLTSPQRLNYDPARGLLYVGQVTGETLVFRATL